MGTTYRLSLKSTDDPAQIQLDVDNALDEINQQMSTYIDESELMTFNRIPANQCFKLSTNTYRVMEESYRIFKLSEGAFNPSLGPLIELWGFDKKETNDRVPTSDEIKNAQSAITFKDITFDADKQCVTKPSADLFVNFSAIAKGFAVDQVSELIERVYGAEHYLVEVGGEVKTKGVNAKGLPWRIAIEAPVVQDRIVQKIVNPGIMAMATSGDYRNYFEVDGKRYSHTIDPVSGYPIKHNLASVTVIHSSAMTADGLATAIMVMGPKQGMALANSLKLPTFMIVKTESGFEELANSYFEPFFVKTSKQQDS